MDRSSIAALGWSFTGCAKHVYFIVKQDFYFNMVVVGVVHACKKPSAGTGLV
jgi:hypothetical protein